MNEKLVLQDLVEALSKKAKITKKEADFFFRELFQLILERIFENDLVKIKDFGTFKLTSISSRESVDVNTGAKIEIPAHLRLTFSPDKVLKNLVNKPFSQFETILLEDDVEFGSVEDDSDDDIVDIQDKFEIDDSHSVGDGFDDSFDTSELGDGREEAVDFQKTMVENLIENDDVDIHTNNGLDPIQQKKTYPTSFVYTYTTSSSKSETVVMSVPKGDLVVSSRKESLTSADLSINEPSSVGKILLEKRQSVLITEPDLSDVEPNLVTVNDKPIGHLSEIEPKSIVKIEGLDVESEIETEEDVVFLPTAVVSQSKRNSIDLGISERNISIIKNDNNLERPLIPLEDELEGADLNVVLTNSSNKIGLDKSQEIDSDRAFFSEPIGSDNAPYVAPIFNDVNDLFNYEKPTLGSKIKKNLPVILIVLAILIFVIYSFIKLFDVKYDYEYYLGQNNLTLADTLPLVDEAPILDIDIDSVQPSVITSDESVLDIPLDTNLPTDEKNELKNNQVNKKQSVRDTLAQRIDVSKSERVISSLLDIGVVNKGAFYLSKHSQPENSSLVESSLIKNDIRNVKKDVEEQQTLNGASKSIYVTMEHGTTLRSLATRYYGNPSYWVYIYQANRAKLSNPNDISIGMRISIPELSIYGIKNQKDPQEIQKAIELESQLLRW